MKPVKIPAKSYHVKMVHEGGRLFKKENCREDVF